MTLPQNNLPKDILITPDAMCEGGYEENMPGIADRESSSHKQKAEVSPEP
jgi:hypothetical protein